MFTVVIDTLAQSVLVLQLLFTTVAFFPYTRNAFVNLCQFYVLFQNVISLPYHNPYVIAMNLKYER